MSMPKLVDLRVSFIRSIDECNVIALEIQGDLRALAHKISWAGDDKERVYRLDYIKLQLEGKLEAIALHKANLERKAGDALLRNQVHHFHLAAKELLDAPAYRALWDEAVKRAAAPATSSDATPSLDGN